MTYGRDITYQQLVDEINKDDSQVRLIDIPYWPNGRVPTGAIQIDNRIYATWNSEPCARETYWVEIEIDG